MEVMWFQLYCKSKQVLLQNVMASVNVAPFMYSIEGLSYSQRPDMDLLANCQFSACLHIWRDWQVLLHSLQLANFLMGFQGNREFLADLLADKWELQGPFNVEPTNRDVGS